MFVTVHPLLTVRAACVCGRAALASQLSENVIKVLRAIQCPHPLQANQIQGSDFSAMYPVIQWLVKKARGYTWRGRWACAVRVQALVARAVKSPLPVVPSLQVIEAREQSGDTVRKQSEMEFKKTFYGAVPPAIRSSTSEVNAWGV